MARLTGPLLSQNASGQFGKTLIFNQKKSGQFVRGFHYPKKTVTNEQWWQRQRIGMLTAQWQCMSAGEKTVYNDQAKADFFAGKSTMSGFNLFVREAMADFDTVHGLVLWYPYDEATGAICYDQAGGGYNQTLLPTYPTDSPTRVDGVNKSYVKALSAVAAVPHTSYSA